MPPLPSSRSKRYRPNSAGSVGNGLSFDVGRLFRVSRFWPSRVGRATNVLPHRSHVTLRPASASPTTKLVPQPTFGHCTAIGIANPEQSGRALSRSVR